MGHDTVVKMAYDLNESTWPSNSDYWIKIIREGLDPYRLELTNEAMLRVIDPRPGMSILDVGCGEGYLTRLVAERGADVAGLDYCNEFVVASREEARRRGMDICYEHGDATSLPYPEASFDAVVANHLFNELPDMDAAVAEFARVLKPGGRVIALMLHPCFYRANFQRTDRLEPILPSEYFGIRELSQKFLVSGLTSPEPVLVRLRPLEAYFGAFAAAGLTVTQLFEPHPSAEQMKEEWWQRNFRIPLFLQLVGTKLP